MIEQCVILCGGLGSRLGELTRRTPKPLLPVGDKPFLEWLVREVVRQGVRRILLLAAFEAEQVQAFADRVSRQLGIDVQVGIEPERAGTGGALWYARELLDEEFILMNGDSFLDVLLADAVRLFRSVPSIIGALALRELDDTSRFGVVEVDGNRIVSFSARHGEAGSGLVNGGVYAFSKEIVQHLREQSSLEADIMPGLAASGRLLGLRTRSYFLDIGVPDSYERAQTEIPKKLTRPAIFFDRDGVLNVDHGHVGTIDHFEWQPGAREAIRAANVAGYLVFVITNQAGIGKGYYSEADFHKLMAHVRSELFEVGAHLDDIRYCPYHPEAVVCAYRGESDWRKPNPGMLFDLMRRWDIDATASFVVGDKGSDLLAAQQSGLKGFLFEGGDLLEFLQHHTPFASGGYL